MEGLPAATAGQRATGGWFVETHWSMVMRAGQPEGTEAAAALEMLCRSYWYPVYAWVRTRGHGPEDAKDLTQEFLAELIRKGSIGRAVPEKGRFRNYLVRSLENFLTDCYRHERAEKRGGNILTLELDAMDAETRYALEPASHDTPDLAFDRCWSDILVTAAMHRLEAEQASAGRTAQFRLLHEFIGGTPDPGDYERAAEALGLTENGVAVTVRRLRLRCRELIMDGIMQTVATPGDAESELRALFGK